MSYKKNNTYNYPIFIWVELSPTTFMPIGNYFTIAGKGDNEILRAEKYWTMRRGGAP